MRLNEQERLAVVAEAKAEMLAWYKSKRRKQPISYFCHWWAFFTVKYMRAHGLDKAQLQAGSAYWPILTKETDDGVSPTRFGYEFDYDTAVRHLIAGHGSPELHVWVAIAQQPVEIVDLTAPFFKERAIASGMRFAAPITLYARSATE